MTTRYLVQLRERGGQPWSTPRVVFADTPEQAAREAFPEPPSSLNVKHAWVAALAEPYSPTQVEIDVPKPKWGKARPAQPGSREPQREVEAAGSEYVLPDDVQVSFTTVGRAVEDVDRSLYDDRDLGARAEREAERAL